MAKTIRNGRAFPKTVKAATIAEVVVQPNKAYREIAKERNMSESTVRTWSHAAGVTRPSKQHPRTAAAVKARWAHAASIKAFNTPTVQVDGSIKYQGKIYK